jgi:hypothetical protein
MERDCVFEIYKLLLFIALRPVLGSHEVAKVGTKDAAFKASGQVFHQLQLHMKKVHAPKLRLRIQSQKDTPRETRRYDGRAPKKKGSCFKNSAFLPRNRLIRAISPPKRLVLPLKIAVFTPFILTAKTVNTCKSTNKPIIFLKTKN